MVYVVNKGFTVNGVKAGEEIDLNGNCKATKKLVQIGAIKK